MKTSKLILACGLFIGLTAASCGNPGENRNTHGVDSIFSDSVAHDTATWGDTTVQTDTTLRTDSLSSPSFP